MSRPSRDEFWYGQAAHYATRATCPRAQIGAVLVKFDRLIGAGFNGAPEGEPHCLETEGETLALHMALGHCNRARHAEVNALRNALLPPFGATLYVSGSRPICIACKARLRENGVTDIRDGYDVPNLDALARRIAAWGADTFGASTPESTAEHLRREVDELLEQPTNAEEQADLFHLLIQLARVSGNDLPAAVERKFAINQRRIWAPPDRMGVVEHVREARS